jgi:hypothetical protein
VLLRLAYLGVTNVFALLRLLPVSSRDKDAEILALRHQLLVLQRQLGPDRARFTPADRALLAALLHRLPGNVLKRLHLVVHPDTVLRWHRDMLARAPREFEQFYNGHRPHQGIADARPLQPLPVPLAAPDQIASLDIRRRDRLGGVLYEYRHAA